MNSLAFCFLYGTTFTSIHDYWKNHSFENRNFVGKVMSLLFNMLSRLVIDFVPQSTCLLILQLQSLSTLISESKKIKSVTVSTFPPSTYHEVMGLDATIFILKILSFKPVFLLSSLILIKRLFSSSSLSAIRVVSSAYLDVIDISILITAYNASSPAFHMMYSAYDKLNKQS